MHVTRIPLCPWDALSRGCYGPRALRGTLLGVGPSWAWDPRDAGPLGWIPVARDTLGKDQRRLAHPAEATQTSPRWWVPLNFGLWRGGEHPKLLQTHTVRKIRGFTTCTAPTYAPSMPPREVGNFKDTPPSQQGRRPAKPTPKRFQAAFPHLPGWDVPPGDGQEGTGEGFGAGIWGLGGGVSHL